MKMVLSKYIAHAGICSRRNAALLVKDGKVRVNGALVEDPSHRVREKDIVKVGKKHIKLEEPVYLLFNKPENCVSTLSDNRDRTTVIDLIKGAPKVRLYPVGRLDRMTTGLLVMTNDGEFAQKLAHPSNDVRKTYCATLDRPLTSNDLEAIKKGVRIDRKSVVVDKIAYVPRKREMQVKISLHSGLYRVIHRIFEQFDYKVKHLDRINYAGLTQKGLLPGRWRLLKDSEVVALKS